MLNIMLSQHGTSSRQCMGNPPRGSKSYIDMEDLFGPPPDAPPTSRNPERHALLQDRFYEELAARDDINRDTDERVAAFTAGAQVPCYDPLFIEFVTDTQANIAHLQERIRAILSVGPNDADIAEFRQFLETITPFLTSGDPSIHTRVQDMDKMTEQLVKQRIPAAMRELEKDLEMNRALRARLQELKDQAPPKPSDTYFLDFEFAPDDRFSPRERGEPYPKWKRIPQRFCRRSRMN
jgi:hypothetical protein